jgi:hypothetical protein
VRPRHHEKRFEHHFARSWWLAADCLLKTA